MLIFQVLSLCIFASVQLIKLCDGTVAVRAVNMVAATNPRLSIATDCSQGPKYWCASQWNANQCGVSSRLRLVQLFILIIS